MELLLWKLLGQVLFPLWLLVGLVDYWTHQRTDIARTAGPHEPVLHGIEALQVGLCVLIVLFVELNALALVTLAGLVLAHTVTGFVDIRYANSRREILPLEQLVHCFLVTLPIFALAILAVLHWPVDPAAPPRALWTFRWREPAWEVPIIVAVLSASLLFAVAPVVAELVQSSRTSRKPRQRD